MMKKVALITGASDGIGAQAARMLAESGWQVAVIGRSPEKTEQVAKELDAPFYIADFTILSEVASLAKRLNRDWPRIDLLANNAGGIFGKQPLTVDGHELTFQVNHLAHFLLTGLLMPRLIESRAAVISTSSAAHRLMGFRFDPEDLDMRRGFSQHLAYGSTKLANILFTRELHRRYHALGLNVAAFHPGIVGTSFASGTRSPMNLVYHSGLSRLMMKTPREGADTLVWLAQGTPGKDWESGGYYVQRRKAPISRKAQNDGLAAALWEKSLEYCRDFLGKDS